MSSENNKRSPSQIIKNLGQSSVRSDIPEFRSGDTVRVHAKIVEGSKERIQVFEGLVISRRNGSAATASFTVRKVSYNVGVERTFLLHSPRIEKIEVVSRGRVRRSRLYYLRNIRGKASRIKSELETPAVGGTNGSTNGNSSKAPEAAEVAASA